MPVKIPDTTQKLYVSGGCGVDHEVDENNSFSCEVCEDALKKMGYHRSEGWSFSDAESTG